MNKITRFEKARLISARALQISLGAPALVKAPLGTSIFEIAKLELEKKILPLTACSMPNGRVPWRSGLFLDHASTTVAIVSFMAVNS